jgi:hypothetical protein
VVRHHRCHAQGANSDVFVKEAMRLMRERGYSLGNLDATIIAEVVHRIHLHMALAEIGSATRLSVSLSAKVSLQGRRIRRGLRIIRWVHHLLRSSFACIPGRAAAEAVAGEGPDPGQPVRAAGGAPLRRQLEGQDAREGGQPGGEPQHRLPHRGAAHPGRMRAPWLGDILVSTHLVSHA